MDGPHKYTHTYTHKYLSLHPLPVVVEDAEAVEFVLWRRVVGVGLTAPAARFMSGFRPRRWSLIQRNTQTGASLSICFVPMVLASVTPACEGPDSVLGAEYQPARFSSKCSANFNQFSKNGQKKVLINVCFHALPLCQYKELVHLN